jgi:predicted RNA binding protein YcfA (HicA-like mRNA interferase family)
VILKHPDKPHSRVTIAMHRQGTVKPRTLLAIINSAEMTVEQFVELL